MFIYKKPKYCVYLTIYKGNKLPPFYIGSTTIERVTNGYHGSIKSKKYKKIYGSELSSNRNLFKTKIIGTYYTREYALYKERKIQEKLNVVKSPLYMNMSIAKDFGWFGMDTKGENSPVFGKRWKKNKEQIENTKKACLRAFNTPEYKQKISNIRKNKIPRSKKQIEEKVVLYKKILDLYNSKPKLKLEYDYISKNGKKFTYERAFSKEYSEHFKMTSNGIYKILTEDNLIKKLL